MPTDTRRYWFSLLTTQTHRSSGISEPIGLSSGLLTAETTETGVPPITLSKTPRFRAPIAQSPVSPLISASLPLGGESSGEKCG